MKLTRHTKPSDATSGDGQSVSSIWAVDGRSLPEDDPDLPNSLSGLLSLPTARLHEILADADLGPGIGSASSAPIDAHQELWAAGVTYLKSREARMEESDTADIYEKVYSAKRPEIFFKANGWRVKGPEQPIRIRRDSGWDVPEPELAIVINSSAEVIGYTAGNDVSSRSIEGENPLYLPQAKVYDGSAALGDGIILCDSHALSNIEISMRIERAGQIMFEGETNTAQLKRGLGELAGCLFEELEFPHGVILMTGTCLVPDDQFSLSAGDQVTVTVGELTLHNPVET